MVAPAFALALTVFGVPEPQAAAPSQTPTVATLRQGEGPHRLALPVAATDDEIAALRPSMVRGPLARFLQSEGRGWHVVWDRRSGLPMVFEGPGLPLAGASGEAHARGLLRRFPGLLGIDEDVDVDGQPDGDNDLQSIHFRKRTGKAHGARLTFVVNHGRLIQIHAEKWTPRRGAQPIYTVEQGLARLRDRAQLPADPIDLTYEITDVALAMTAEPPGVYTGAFGAGYDTHTIYAFRFKLPADVRSFVAYVDVESGELLDLFDDNKYEAAFVKGAIFPRTSNSAEALVPFADVTVTNGTTKTTDLGGGYVYAGGSASTSLAGKYFKVTDTCGAPSASTSAAPGDLTLGSSSGSDCSLSAEGPSTRAARNAFFHLNNVRRMGEKWLGGVNTPATSWFASNVGVNVNLDQTCNAFWNGSTVNFFKSDARCNNTGEISDVMQHEWGHGLDANTKSGSVGESAKGEAVADTIALLMTHDSCIGPNFLAAGEGETAACPTGVRDLNYSVTQANIGSLCQRSFGCAGALGYECHCESHLLSGVHWDLVKAFEARYGPEEGWNQFERGFLRALPMTTAYLPATAGNAYDAWIAADDDNGDTTDGTPNGDIIYKAFNDRGLAGSQHPQKSVVCPTRPAAPSVTATSSVVGIVVLDWAPVSGAMSYAIFRRLENGSPAYLPLASAVTATEYADTQAAPDYEYGYQVVALTSSGCTSPYGSGVVATAPARPLNDFSIGASPSSLVVTSGSTATITVTTVVTSGGVQTIALSIAGLPPGVAGSFNPPSVAAGASSTLTVTATADATAATSSATITGVSVSGVHTASIDVTIQSLAELALQVRATLTAIDPSLGNDVDKIMSKGCAEAVKLQDKINKDKKYTAAQKTTMLTALARLAHSLGCP